MSFELVLSAVAAAAGAAVVADNFYFASAQDVIWNGVQAVSGARTLIRGRCRIDIGSFDRKTLRFSFGNKGNASPYDVLDAALEAPDGTIIPVRKGGANTWTVPAGAVKDWVDVVSATDVPGYTKFTVGEAWQLNYITTAPAATTGNYGNIGFIYNPATTTPKSVDVAGTITFTGTDFGSATGVNIITVGQAHGAITRPVWFVVGDSIGLNVSDTGDGALRRKGFIHRGMYDSDVAGATCDAMFNTSVSGQSTAGYLLSNFFTDIREFAQYATHVIDELGINSLGTTGTGSIATIYAEMQSIYSGLQTSAGAPSENTTPVTLKFYRTKMMTRTNSANTAVAGTGYEPGGNMDVFNAGLATQPNVLGVLDDRAAVLDPVTNLWLAGMFDALGLHPLTVGHVAKTPGWRAFRQAVTV